MQDTDTPNDDNIDENNVVNEYSIPDESSKSSIEVSGYENDIEYNSTLEEEGDKDEESKDEEDDEDVGLEDGEEDERTNDDDDDKAQKTTNIKAESSSIVTDSTIESLSNFFFDKKKSFQCQCGYIIEMVNLGNIKCPNPKCGKSYKVTDKELNISEYSTLFDEKEIKEYSKILSHIQNKTIDRNFEEAYNYCLKAQAIAPGESITWQYFALTEFFYETTRRKGKKITEIIKNVRRHLEKAGKYGMSPADVSERLKKMADELLNAQKATMGNIKASRKDINGYDKWSREDLANTLSCLKSVELCYSLYKDERYLEECVKELTKPHKWLIKKSDDGEIVSTPSCGIFDAIAKLKWLIDKIKEHKPEYEAPEIASERCIIKKAEFIKIKSAIKMNN